MRVLAINSSLRKGQESRTELMLGNLVKGMRESGAIVETVNLRDKKINYCIGCFTCMTKTPGKCVQKDDMTNELFPKWLNSDLVIYATPLFHHTVNAPMKAFIERCFPVCEPFLEQHESGRWIHPYRHKYPAIVVLSVCGFLEESAFGALSHYLNFMFHREEAKLVAEIYRPGSHFITQPACKTMLDDILDATRQAGRELVQSMKVSPKTLSRIKQPISDLQIVKDMANIVWKTCIDEGITIGTFERKEMVPRPDSLDTYMKLMTIGFNAEAAGDTKAVLQFTFTGSVEGSCFFSINNRTINAKRGNAKKADLSVDAPFDVWMDIVTRKADGAQSFVEGKYQATGDLSLMQMFGRER
jgi:multimeric flavodoxin WrbA/putative sterol carrier protein